MSVSYTYDANGNTLTERTNGTVSATYAYDAENKLIFYTAGNVGYTYGYYPSGLRRTKTALNAQTNASTLTNTYVWDGNNLVKDNTDAYRYGLSAISRNNTYYLHDAHGSVVGIANSSGSISKTYAYDAFGVELSPAASDANPFRYSGEYFDAETGDYYLRARYYAPGLGPFLSEDPVRDGNNWYVYCNNNPVRYVDPSGKIAVVDDALVTLVLVTGAIVTGTAEWLASPEGQKAINNGAKIIHDAAQTIVEGVQAGIEGVKEFVGDVVDTVSNWIFGASDEGNISEKDTTNPENNASNKGKENKQTTPNQMQKQVEKDQAPDSVSGVHNAHEEKTGKPHIRFGKGEAALNNDGTWHDEGKNKPPHELTNKEKKWITSNGWSLPK